jgi:hypothetical protein
LRHFATLKILHRGIHCTFLPCFYNIMMIYLIYDFTSVIFVRVRARTFRIVYLRSVMIAIIWASSPFSCYTLVQNTYLIVCFLFGKKSQLTAILLLFLWMMIFKANYAPEMIFISFLGVSSYYFKTFIDQLLEQSFAFSI